MVMKDRRPTGAARKQNAAKRRITATKDAKVTKDAGGGSVKQRKLTSADCKGCGACCQYVRYPMGFHPAYCEIVGEHTDWEMEPENAALWATVPPEAKKIYIRTKKAVDRSEYDEDRPCCWLDPATRECRFYAYRPMVCREKPIDWACFSYRKQYGVVTVNRRGA